MFKVGDKVILKPSEYISVVWKTTNGSFFDGSKIKFDTIYEVSELGVATICVEGQFHSDDRFKLVTEPCKEKPAITQEIKIGDVWISSWCDYKIQIVSKTADGRYGVIIRSGKNIGSTLNCDAESIISMKLLHREPEKQKPQVKQEPKKQEEWEMTRVVIVGFYGQSVAIRAYNKGTLTKAVLGDIVTYASPKAPDVYDAKRGEQVAVAKCYAEWLLRWAKEEVK